jgi:hypothetical protein
MSKGRLAELRTRLRDTLDLLFRRGKDALSGGVSDYLGIERSSLHSFLRVISLPKIPSMSIARRFVVLAACVLATTPLAAQTVRGKVLDAATGEGIAEAAVQARSADGHNVGRARTGPDGSFQMPLRAAATVRIEAQRAGYRTTLTDALPVDLREAVEVEVRLSAAALAIEPLRVTARVEPPHRRNLELNGYYGRERQGIGEYLRREDIEKRASSNLAQVLQRVPGTSILYRGSHQYVFFPRNGSPSLNTSIRGAPGNACLPRLFVDGSRVTYDAQNDINSVVNPNQVEGIEIFRGPSEIPVQYNDSNSMCGVILIWTRTEP